MRAGEGLGPRRKAARHAWLLAALVVLGGCTAPLTVEQLGPQAAYRRLDRSALSENLPSEAARITLRRRGLLESLDYWPDETIAALHAQTVRDPAAWSDFFALAELSYLRGRQTGSPSRYLASAIYAYAFLFPDAETEDRPSPFDPRLRQATDLYNLGLTTALTPADGDGAAVFRSGPQPLPFGVIDIAVDEDSLRSGGRTLTSFRPTGTLAVQGMQNQYRTPGIGAPMAASVAPPPSPERGVQLAPRLRIPSTALLQVPQARQQLAAGTLHGTLAVHTIFAADSIRISGQRVPLEFDQTATRAYSLVEARAWSNEYRGFLFGDLLEAQQDTNLVGLEPHRRGRMPVVLIHGTASSPFRWADMVNDLTEDPRIRDNYEFWFFSYATGNPIPYSALLLRDSLQTAVQQLGGEAADPALGRMVLIGHSQGGLLARLLTVDAGTRLWDSVSRRPLDELKMDAASRDLIRRSLFVERLPQVERVVFIATPHGGSYLTEFSVTRLIGRLVTLPATLARTSIDALANADALTFDTSQWRPGSLYGMTPGSPLIRALAPLPVAPGVHVHSIIPTLGDGPLAERSDGVVRYASAHLAGAESEAVVRSSHSVQANPAAIEEVRRILLLQLATPCVRDACRPAATVRGAAPAETARQAPRPGP
ncbi:MAG: alpha/beta fold hydrolase [Paracraurococcus sp.]